jgi:tetratricopeptide (TPR) repeat protein
MKKVFVALVGLFLAATPAMQAQDEGAKLAKEANKNLASFNRDPAGNQGKLEEARLKIDEAVQKADAANSGSIWQIRGDIYNAFVQKDLALRSIDANAKPKNPKYAYYAFESFAKAFQFSEKKYDKSQAIKGIAEVQSEMLNGGIDMFSKEQFEDAYLMFSGALQADELLKANNQKSVFGDDQAQRDDVVYYTGLAALQAKRTPDAARYFETLYNKGTDKAAVYEGLYNVRLAAGDEAGAQKILTEGRQKFPQDGALLFAEINTFLKAGKLDQLIGSLKEAIQKEPTNMALYTTLGNVYDQLYQSEIRNKNEAKAQEYYNAALEQYQATLAKDANNVDANYALGALYFNKAAIISQQMNDWQDYSGPGLKKLDAMKVQMMSLFDQALPYFQKAEMADPNDLNTLIALSEIFARKEDERSLEFKKRIETVRGGGKNETSFFKQ